MTKSVGSVYNICLKLEIFIKHMRKGPSGSRLHAHTHCIHTAEQFVKRPFGIEAQFLHETSENLKEHCFNLTNRLGN